MASIDFTVHHDFDHSAQQVWDELVDWKGHEHWIPMTTVDVHTDGDATAIGSTFTAYTGIGPLKLEDRMRVDACDWDQADGTGHCTVAKLGPVLTGSAGFNVEAQGPSRSSVEWIESVEVRWVPRLLAPIVGKIGALGFKQGMRGLAKRLDRATT